MNAKGESRSRRDRALVVIDGKKTVILDFVWLTFIRDPIPTIEHNGWKNDREDLRKEV